MTTRVAIVGLMGALALCACSPPEASNWRPVTLAELKGLPGYEYRISAEGDYLSATGDFNGDGVQDRVALMRDDVAKLNAFMAFLGGSQEVHPVAGLQLADISRTGVASVPPGVYPTACPRQDGVPTLCDPPKVTFEKDAINIFGFNSTGIYMYYVGGAFQNVGVSERPTP